MAEIAGKTVLVTGGGIRVGRALCEAFARAGANLIIHCNSSLSAAEELREKLTATTPGHHTVLQVDFAQPGAAETVFRSVPAPVDILVNNAAVFLNRPLAEESNLEFAGQMRVNFNVPVELMRHFARQPGLTEGCIINFLDQQIVRHPANTGSYLLSKQSLAEATLLAARQLAPSIRVNGIAPGPALPPPGISGPGFQKVLENVPLRRPVALDDLGSACLFLATNNSITGQILFVDGGQHLT